MNPQTISSTTSQYVHAAGHLSQAALTLYNANLLPFEILAVLVVAVLVVGTIIIIIKTGWFALHVDHVRDVILKTDMPKKRAGEAWAAVQKHFFAGDVNDLKIAIVEADNILNDALRYAGVRGVNLGDRLKNIKHGTMPNLEDVWTAHKLRNEIAHETNFSLKRDTTERALNAYEVALKNLGVFDK
jgi:hypothetical protein